MVAILLTVCMLVAMVPSMAFADPEGGAEPPTLDQQFSDLKDQYEALSDAAKAGQAGQEAKALLDSLEVKLGEYNTAVGNQAGLDGLEASAKAEFDKYAPAVITQTQSAIYTTGNSFTGTNYIDFTFTIMKQGGEDWQAATGVNTTLYKVTISWPRITGTSNGVVNAAKEANLFVDKWYKLYSYQEDPSTVNAGLVAAIYASTGHSDFVANRTGAEEAYNSAKQAAGGNEELVNGYLTGDESIPNLISALSAKLGTAEADAKKITLNISGLDTIYVLKNKEGGDTYSVAATLPDGVKIETNWSVENPNANLEASIDGDGKLIVKSAIASDVPYQIKITSNASLDAESIDAGYTIKSDSITSKTVNVYVSDITIANDEEVPTFININEDAYANAIGGIAYRYDLSAKGGTAPYTYSFEANEGSEVDSRIALSEDGQLIVDKESNSGNYSYTYKATDKNGLLFETVIEFEIYNYYDEQYALKLKELQDIEAQIATIKELAAIAGTDIPAKLDLLEGISAAYAALWNEGTPQGGIAAITEIADQFGIPTLGLSNFQSLISSNLTKQRAIDGYKPSINILGLLLTSPIDLSAPSLYYSAVLSTWDSIVNSDTAKILVDLADLYTFAQTYNQINSIGGLNAYAAGLLSRYDKLNADIEDAGLTENTPFIGGLIKAVKNEINPVVDVLRAYVGLADFVANEDYSKLKDINSINDYIQTLALKYDALQTALENFSGGNSIAKGIVEGVLANSNGLIAAATLPLGPILKSIVSSQLDNEDFTGLADGLIDESLARLNDLIVAAPDVTLADLVNFSGQINDALQKIAEVSAFITGIVNYAKAFDLDAFLQGEIDALRSYVDALKAAGKEELADYLQKQLAEISKAIKDNYGDDIDKALAIIAQINELRDKVAAALDGFDSAKAIAELINDFNALKKFVEANVKEGKEALIKEIDKQIDLLKDVASKCYEKLSDKAKAEMNNIIDKAEQELDKLWGKVLKVSDKILKEIDKAIRAIPNPYLTLNGDKELTEFTFETYADQAKFSTNYNRLINVVEHWAEFSVHHNLGIFPAFSATLADGGALPNGLELSKTGKLSVTDPALFERQESDGDNEYREYRVKVSTKTGVFEIDKLLSRLGYSPYASGEYTIKIKLPVYDYSITYVVWGGDDIINPNPTTYNILSGDIVLVGLTGRTGYSFSGWYSDVAQTDPVSVPAIAAGSKGDRVFYAKWTKDKNKNGPKKEEETGGGEQGGEETGGGENGGGEQGGGELGGNTGGVFTQNVAGGVIIAGAAASANDGSIIVQSSTPSSGGSSDISNGKTPLAATDSGVGFPWWIIAAVAVILGGLFFIIGKKRRKDDKVGA
ncbi:MAG: hypothetical protein LBN34_01665 [Clostridiales Family XIII bacterium]|nr:hypothetical protein [Clostridiales Family XIII bacterium]